MTQNIRDHIKQGLLNDIDFEGMKPQIILIFPLNLDFNNLK